MNMVICVLLLSIAYVMPACSRQLYVGAGTYTSAEEYAGQTFVLKKSSNQEATVNFGTGEQRSEVTISSEEISVKHTQKSQDKLITNEKEQEGREETKRTDTVKAEIDIGIIIDDSESVEDDQRAAIAEALSKGLAKNLTDSHWQVHITGTSKGGDKRVGLVNWKHSKKADAMKKYMVQTKSRRSKDYHNELALYKARALAEQHFRKGNDVIKAFIIISDEDMQCYVDGEFTHFCDKVARNFKRDFADPSNSAVYGIIANYPNSACGRVKEFGGQKQNKCYTTEGDCSTSRVGRFKKNSQGCSNDKNEKYNFSNKKTCGRRGGHLNACYQRGDDWKPNQQAWEDSGLFAITSRIGDNYDAIFTEITKDLEETTKETIIRGEPYANSIDLKHDKFEIKLTTIKVIANGKNIPQTNYSIAGNKLTITGGNMKTVWPTNTKLKVTYKLKSLNKGFDLPTCQSANEVLIKESVKVNGSGSGFTVGTNVIMDEPPASGSMINITAQCMHTVYTLARAEHTLAGTNASCENGGTPIACVHVGETLRFTNPNQIKAGDKINIIQRVDTDKAGMRIKVAENYVVGSAVITIGSDSCDESQLTLNDFTINAADTTNSCPIFNSLRQNRNQDVHLAYKTYDAQNVFNINIPLLVDQHTADVKVNGKPLIFEQDYVLNEDEDTITFINLDQFEIDANVVVNFIPKT